MRYLFYLQCIPAEGAGSAMLKELTLSDDVSANLSQQIADGIGRGDSLKNVEAALGKTVEGLIERGAAAPAGGEETPRAMERAVNLLREMLRNLDDDTLAAIIRQVENIGFARQMETVTGNDVM